MLKKIQFFEADSGHDFGWYVEYNHMRIAELIDPHPYDMFWRVFKLVPLTSDPKYKHLLHNHMFWAGLSFRNRRFQDISFHTIAGYCGNDQVYLRRNALTPSLLECVILALRELVFFCSVNDRHGVTRKPIENPLVPLMAGVNLYEIKDIVIAFCELDMLGYKYEQENFWANSWFPTSAECKKALEWFLLFENRDKLKMFYTYISKTGETIPGANLRKVIENAIGAFV